MSSFGDPPKVPVARASTLPELKKPRTKITLGYTSLPSSPTKRKVHKAEDEFDLDHSFSSFVNGALSEEPANDYEIMWWKVPGVALTDLCDLQLWSKVDDDMMILCGLIRSSPYFPHLTQSQRLDVITLAGLPTEVMFNSIADRFEAKMNDRLVKDRLIVTLNEMEIGLFRYGQAIYAMQNRCPHQGGPLAEGDIEELEHRICIKCPLHSWRFDLTTGRSVQPYREDKPASVFPVRILDGVISVGFTNYDSRIFRDENF